MGVKFKPLFCCEGCGIEYENPDQVRTFKDIVVNGNNTKQFIKQDQMYCINCLEYAIDYKNEVPETVTIIDRSIESNLEEIKESKLTLIDIEAQVEIIDQQCKLIGKYLKSHVDHFDKVDKRLDTLEQKTPGQKLYEEANELLPNEVKEKIKQVIVDTEGDVAKNNINQILDDLDKPLFTNEEFKEEFFETRTLDPKNESISGEPDTISENTESETEEIENIGFDDIGDDSGRYLILRTINNENDENQFAQSVGYKSTKELRDACGLLSLMNLNYSTNRFVDSLDKSYRKVIAKVINKIFFGVPNIVEREIYIHPEYKFTLIEKNIFEDKIEAVKYEVPEEDDKNIGFPEGAEVEIQELPTVNKMLKGFIDDVVTDNKETKKPIISSPQPKKKFFGRDLRDKDDYV